MLARFGLLLSALWLLTAAAPDPGPCVSANAKPYAVKGKQRLVIGTGNTGGVYFPYGGGLARVVSAKLPNTEMTAEVTGGSVDNLKLLAKGQADLALTTVDSAYEAIQGQGVYKDTGKVPACTLAVLYTSFVHIVASEASGIKSVADMKGRRVSVGSPGSSTEVLANRVLETAGLDPKKDVSPQYLSVSEAAGALKDGKVEAFFWIGGLPTAAVTDLVTTGTKVRFLDGSPYVEKLKAKYGPIYTAQSLPKSVYDQPADVGGIGVGNLVTVNAAMPEKLAQDLLKTIFDNLDEVKKIHPEAKALSLKEAATTNALPFHPGAVAYFKEKGVWP